MEHLTKEDNNMRHNRYHNHEPHFCDSEQIFYDNHEHSFPNVESGYIPVYKRYKTGTRNPYYKCVDFYTMHNAPNGGKYNINRWLLEEDIETFMGKGFLAAINPNIAIQQYYETIIVWLRATYRKLMTWEITYSNLSKKDSTILIIRRILSKYVCEEEMCKIAKLFDLNLSKTGEEYLNC